MRKRRRKKRKQNDSKGWASFRIRGIKASLETLKSNQELSFEVKKHLSKALGEIRKAVDILNKERDMNETLRNLIH